MGMSNSLFDDRTWTRGNRGNSSDLSNFQGQFEGIKVTNSHTINIAQTEFQGLLVLQLALQAAIEASVVAFGTDESNDVTELKNISQKLRNLQIQSEKVYIDNCNDINITQTEVQLEAVVQATIELLANLSLTIAGTSTSNDTVGSTNDSQEEEE